MVQAIDTSLSHLGLAKEATRGTALNPTMWLPVKNPKPDDLTDWVVDDNLRGIPSKDFGQYKNRQHSTFEFEGNFYPDYPPVLFNAIMGSLDTTGSASPYTHTFTLNNTAQPPTYTISDYDGIDLRQFAGCVLEELQLKYAPDGALTYTAKWAGHASVTGTVGTPTFGTVNPLLGFNCSAKLGGSADANLLGWDITMKRKLDQIFAANSSKDPAATFLGALEVTGKATFLMTDTTELDEYLNDSQPVFDITLSQSASESLEILMSQCAFNKATVNRSKEYVELDTDFRAIYNATDGGPCQVIAINGQDGTNY